MTVWSIQRRRTEAVRQKTKILQENEFEDVTVVNRKIADQQVYQIYQMRRYG